MPLIQIDLDRSLYEAKREEISRAIHEAQMEIDDLAVPENDKFQVFRPRDKDELVFDRTFNGVDRRDPMLIQILMVHRYPVALKQQLYLNILRHLSKVGVRPEDVMIAVAENGYEDWKAGALPSELAK